MSDSNPAGESAALEQCPWCSAVLDDPSVTSCPSCGATLREQVDAELPGVTKVDATATAGKRLTQGKGVRALIGLSDEDTEGSPARALPEPPSEDVRREMLRLRISAIEAEIEARNAALAAQAAEAAAATGQPVVVPPVDVPSGAVPPAAVPPGEAPLAASESEADEPA